MNKFYSIIVLVMLLCISSLSQAQISTLFNGVKFDDSLLNTKEKLRLITNDIKITKIDTPSFPLSKNKEEHLIASNVKVKNTTIDKVVFTFSDDKLSYIQTQGNVINGLTTSIKSNPKKYLHYEVYKSDLLFINTKKDIAWLLTPASLHPNLFTWNNPYFESHKTNYNASVNIPNFIKMGEHIDTLLPLLKKHSEFIEIKYFKQTDAITVKTQINCFGIEFGGFPRKFEAIFKNQKLNMVWILTSKGEENRIREKLTKTYGKAIFINDTWEVFNDWTVLLRKDKPEVLLLTEELGLMYKKQYTK